MKDMYETRGKAESQLPAYTGLLRHSCNSCSVQGHDKNTRCRYDTAKDGWRLLTYRRNIDKLHGSSTILQMEEAGSSETLKNHLPHYTVS
jgi:hypothetical protein